MKATLILPSNVAVLEGALEGLVCADVALMEMGVVPSSPLDDDAHVRYQREQSGYEDWAIASRVMSLGYGDCEDLASWEAAGYRFTGEDEGARAVLYKSGPNMYHCVCLLSSGEIVDVCPALGMTSRHRKGHPLPSSKFTPPKPSRDRSDPSDEESE